MDGSEQWHTMYKTKLVIPSTQTDFLQQHKLFLCGYAVLNWTVWYIINCVCAHNWNWIIYFTHDLQNILYYSVIFDIFSIDLFATVMHVSQIVCVCYSTVMHESISGVTIPPPPRTPAGICLIDSSQGSGICLSYTCTGAGYCYSSWDLEDLTNVSLLRKLLPVTCEYKYNY
jgi:hypothetical protein